VTRIPCRSSSQAHLRSEDQYKTIAAIARESGGVSRETVRALMRQLEAEGRVDVDRHAWPNGYRLKATTAAAPAGGAG
jgi:hypothetical protein